MLLSFKIISLYLQSQELLLITEFFSFSFKLYLLTILIIHSFKTKTYRKFNLLLIAMLSGSMVYSDMSWIPHHIYGIYFSTLDKRIIGLMARLGWVFFSIQNQALVSFLDIITKKRFVIKKWHIASVLLTITTISFQIYFMVFEFNNPALSGNSLTLEQRLIQIQCLHLLLIFIPCLIRTIKNIKSNILPKILAKQLKTFLIYLIFPHLILDLITNKLLFFPLIEKYLFLNEFSIRTISSILISYALYYCCKKMVGLRFLNLKDHVETKDKFNFINDFKDIIEELSYIKTPNELIHITQTFFKVAFDIPISKTKLYIRDINNLDSIENFIISHQDKYLKNSKLFIKDEIEFSNFYQETEERNVILNFLDSTNLDIFLPIYNRNKICSYITIEKDSRLNKLFNNKERDEMLLFTSYLNNIINFLNYSSIDELLKQNKQLKEELYEKHQEINQYKESIRSFVKANNERKIGVILYKNKKFNYVNQAAKDLLSLDIYQENNLTILKDLVFKVTQYKSNETIFIKDKNGNKLALYAISGQENNIIILAYYPEASDIIKAHIQSLKDSTYSDKLLYLETTQSGNLINQLIPGYGENILNFKIELLSLALSKKAILLNLPDEDLDSTVELLHHISLKQNLYKIELNNHEKSDLTVKLFGINDIFNIENNFEQPLLLKLDNIGTLFIKNIELLDLDAQEQIANFITFGYFYKLKSDNKIFSNVRLIFSSNRNLEYLVSENKFSKKLYNELNKATIIMPSFLSLTDKEIIDLAQGFTEQFVIPDSNKNSLILDTKDKIKLLNQRPISLEDLKNKLQRLLISKSVKNNDNKVTFDPAYNISDPIVAKAVRLGKKALKHQDIMISLWDKYKNQNKIASLLGVDRSSVCRRCQQYNLK